MAHTGSKDSAEVDGALRVLQCLTGSLDDATRLAPFLPFVKGALDFIESLKLSQVTYQHPWPSARTHTHRLQCVALQGSCDPPPWHVPEYHSLRYTVLLNRVRCLHNMTPRGLCNTRRCGFDSSACGGTTAHYQPRGNMVSWRPNVMTTVSCPQVRIIYSVICAIIFGQHTTEHGKSCSVIYIHSVSCITLDVCGDSLLHWPLLRSACS